MFKQIDAFFNPCVETCGMGGRPPSVSDLEILRAVQATFGPATAKEVSEQISINKSGTNKRLKELANSGMINRKKVGANAVVYWLSDQGKREVQAYLDPSS